MGDIHVDDFFKDAALTLTRLYLSFPRPVPVFVEDICGPVRTDEFGIPGDRFVACFSTFLWLAEESYLRYTDTIRQEAIDQAVLTGRCFNVLTMPAPDDKPGAAQDGTLPPSIRNEHASNIHHVRDALKSGSSIRVRAVMTHIMALMNE